MISLLNIIGLKVVAIKGFRMKPFKKKKQHIEPVYILFDDASTFIELEEQDYYSFHDCSSSIARVIIIRKNAERWLELMTSGYFPDATKDIG